MEDKRTMKEVLDKVMDFDKNNLDNAENLTSIELLLTDDNNGTIKDASISKNFLMLKEKYNELLSLTNDFETRLLQEHKH